ncbi:MAG: hypothetical protein K5656_03820, partial [Lachnospiraceae bacterium]|nr:hypothetical protein [Lachnospiraceae bacterium]
TSTPSLIATASDNASADSSKDASSNATTEVASANATTEAQATTQASANATTEAKETASGNASANASSDASANASGEPLVETTLGSGLGVALLDGESLELDFSVADVYYVPVQFTGAGYISVSRTDKVKAKMNVSLLNAEKTSSSFDETIAKKESTEQFAVKATDYYLKLSSTSNSKLIIACKFNKGLLFSVGTNKYNLGIHKASKAFYLEYTAKKTGYFAVENMTAKKVSIVLCNSSKKAYVKTISLAAYSSKNHKDKKTIAGFGVKKGVTYLIKLKTAKNVKKVSLKGSLTAYTTVGGKSFKKAKSLASKTTYKATLNPDSKPEYYTFKKTTMGTDLDITVSTKGLKNQGTIKVYLYYKETLGKNKGKILPVKINGKHFGFTEKADYTNYMKIPYNWPNRTYYLKVSNSSKSTGCYTIKKS